MLKLPEKYHSYGLQLIKFSQYLHKKNMLAAADGNLSIRISDQEIIITPSGRLKAFIEPSDCALIDIDNNILYGNPSGERLMHLEVYKKCNKALAVVHAHPPTAVALTIAFPDWNEVPMDIMSELILALGKLPIVNYARPGTLEMGTNLHEFLPQCRALLLARHGALTWGESLTEAYSGMERIEHSAEIIHKAISMGGLTKLPEFEVNALKELRKSIGNKIL